MFGIKFIQFFVLFCFKITERQLCHGKHLEVILFSASVIGPNDKIIESKNDLLMYS